MEILFELDFEFVGVVWLGIVEEYEYDDYDY